MKNNCLLRKVKEMIIDDFRIAGVGIYSYLELGVSF